VEQGIRSFNNEAELQKFIKDNPNLRIERREMLPLPQCPRCYGTGLFKRYSGGIMTSTQCKCVKPRRLKFKRG
jgi:hypothetical protein